ncbi:peptidase inhibitor I78 [Sphingomonas koreensis]|nr:peptidase inhibitor I78 [Sphingomonas koreensis]TPG43684.1 peptidase inhibitor I78 [Sphingomonas koreensis]
MRALLPLALLGACAAAQTPVVGGAAQSCKADGLDDLVGKAATAELGAAALDRSGAKSLRWIQPGTMVTMDFRRDRLNLHLDAGNVVTRINCG